MRRILIVVIVISTLSSLAHAQGQPQPRTSRQFLSTSAPPSPLLYKRGSDVFDFIFHQLNPSDFNWGEWYEARRRAFLHATAFNPDFWYCLLATMVFIVVFAALLKSMHDHKRKVHMMGEQMDQVREHDAYSRRVADEAIRRYNAHTELCNRVVEVEQGGLAIATGEGSRVSQLQADLAAARDEIEMLKRDKSRLGAEVTHPAGLSSEPPHRSESPGNKGNGDGQTKTAPNAERVSISDLVRQINALQQQLYAEKEKNKHLKGGA